MEFLSDIRRFRSAHESDVTTLKEYLINSYNMKGVQQHEVETVYIRKPEYPFDSAVSN